MSDVTQDVDECARLIEEALASMDPPIDVYSGILKLIAEFAQPHGECQWQRSETAADVTLVTHALFDERCSAFRRGRRTRAFRHLRQRLGRETQREEHRLFELSVRPHVVELQQR